MGRYVTSRRGLPVAALASLALAIAAIAAVLLACPPRASALGASSGGGSEIPAASRALTVDSSDEELSNEDYYMISDDGVDYNWLVREGDGWYGKGEWRAKEWPASRRPTPQFILWEDGRVYPEVVANNVLNVWYSELVKIKTPVEAIYGDGTLIYQTGYSVRLDNVVAVERGYPDLYNPLGRFSYRSSGDAFDPVNRDYPGFRIARMDHKLTYYPDAADITSVVFDDSFAETNNPANARAASDTSSYWGGGTSSDDWEFRHLDGWFKGFVGVRSITGLENVYVDYVLSMNELFAGCCQVEELDLSTWKTGACHDFKGMFDGCESLSTIKLGDGWSYAGIAQGEWTARESFGTVSYGPGERPTFPRAMTCLEGRNAGSYRAGDEIPEGPGTYVATEGTSIRAGTLLLAAPGAGEADAVDASGFAIEYTGSLIEPVPVLSIGGRTLERGRDYEVSYSDNIGIGTGTVVIEGKGAYYGVIRMPFAIKDAGACAFLFEDGTMVIKDGLLRPGSDVVPDSVALVDGPLKWTTVDEPGRSAEVPWKKWAKQVRRVVLDKSLEKYRPTSAERWFAGFTELTEVKGWNSPFVFELETLSGMFSGCTSLKGMDFEYAYMDKLTDVSYLFEGCASLENHAVIWPFMSWPVDVHGTFKGCTSLTEFVFRRDGPSNVQDMRGMLEGCTSLRSAEFTSYAHDGAISWYELDIRGIFKGCASLVDANVSGMPAVAHVGGAFEGCASLRSLNLGNFGLAWVDDAPDLLKGCAVPEEIVCGRWWSNFGDKALTFPVRAFSVSPYCRRCLAGSAIPGGAGVYRTSGIDMGLVDIRLSGSAFTCTGSEIRPTARVTLGGAVLTEGIDYTLSYSDNVLPGTATVTATGMGAFTGKASASFAIEARVTKVGDRIIYRTKEAVYTLEVTKTKKVGGEVLPAEVAIVRIVVQSSSTKTLTLPSTCTVGSIRVDVTSVGAKLSGRFRNVSNVVIGPKVVTIAAAAFSKAPKVKQLVVKSVRLKTVKNCLKGSKVAKVTAKCWLNKDLKSKYKSWFTKAAGKAGVKFVYKIPA